MISQNKVDPDRVFAFGKSHGGFLSGILAGRFEKYFAGAVLLNPVLSFPSVISANDIPDWVAVEALNREDTIQNLTE